MASFGGLGIGLSFLFGCILFFFVGQVYYLLWWKKRIIISSCSCRESEGHQQQQNHQYTHTKCAQGEIFSLFSWKKKPKPEPVVSVKLSPEFTSSVVKKNPEAESNREPEGPVGKDVDGDDQEGGVEAELKRLHNLWGPPRFLFSIKEESKEDLESNYDGKSRKGSRTKSLSDVLVALESPILTPLHHHHGGGGGGYIANPLFESWTERDELNKLRSSSPPPTFKFLRDAEDKLMMRRRLNAEAEKRALKALATEDRERDKDRDDSFFR